MRTLSIPSVTTIDPGLDWAAPPWRDITAAVLNNHMGDTPSHFPKTEVKLAWSADRVWVLFRVEDQYIRAVATAHQDSVCGDSCVEFFFTPSTDSYEGYFNLEINCGGTVLFHWHPTGQKEHFEPVEFDDDDLKIRHSMPRIVDPEITSPMTWTVQFSLPVALLQKYCKATVQPQPNARWRGNLYKCADNTSHPHWLTWSPVDFPTPNFHLPRCFGVLAFT